MAPRYAILGYARSGESAYRYLTQRGAETRIYVPEGEYETLRRTRPDLPLAHIGDEIYEDTMVRSPGIRPDAPFIIRAQARGARLTSEVALFCEACRAPIYGVTGSDGKTTTATLAARMLEAEGRVVHLGGNIGVPLLDRLGEIQAHHCVVLELSSFQLMDFTPRLAAGAVTNFTENHLDWHRDMAEYRMAKCRILTHAQRRVQNARCILRPELSGVTFSAQCATANYHLTGGQLMRGDEPLVSVGDVLLRGIYNLENLLCAAALTGAGAGAVRRVATTFAGVAHRMEYCGMIRGVRCWNSSIDTTPARTAASLSALADGATVIVGGAGKRLSPQPLVEALVRHAARVVFTGETGQEMREAFIAHACEQGSHDPTCPYIADYRAAWDTALAMTEDGGDLLLSPASTSFDAFSSYAERGETFRTWVREQKNQ